MAGDLTRRLFNWKQMLGRGLFARTPASLRADQDGKQSFQRAVLGERAAIYGNERAVAEFQAAWPEIAGPLSKHSWPMKVKGSKLHVRVEKSVYAQELSLRSTAILGRLHGRGHGHIKRIMIDVGTIDWSSYYGGAEQNKAVPGQKNEPDDSDIPISAAAREMLEGLRDLKNRD